MKTNTLFLLASLAVFAANASAAQSQPETVVLPTYVVEAPRYQPAEQQINSSLIELRQQARSAVFICPDFAALKAQVRQGTNLVQLAKDMRSARLAKL